jgi:hypothetical protein
MPWGPTKRVPRDRITADFSEPIALAVNGGTGRYQLVSGQGNFIQVADGRFGVVFQLSSGDEEEQVGARVGSESGNKEKLQRPAGVALSSGRSFCLLWCPRQDSNLRTALRRRVLYPLSYGGGLLNPSKAARDPDYLL